MEQGRGLGVISGRFFIVRTVEVHTKAQKIQLSIICSDLIAMVTGRGKILIRPVLATRRNGMVEGRWKMKQTEGGNTERWDVGTASVYLNLCVLMSRVNKSS